MKAWILKCLCIVFAFSQLASAQNSSIHGTDFWFSYITPSNVFLPAQEVYISATQRSAGTVAVPSQDWQRQFTVDANTTIKITLPPDIYPSNVETIQQGGIHITSTDEISVYAHYNSFEITDASQIYPTSSLGHFYVATCGKPFNYNANFPSEVLALATQDATVVEITPSIPTLGGHNAGERFSVTLNAGEFIQLQSGGDLSGTIITSCKPFAAFSGVKLSDGLKGCGFGDYVYEQLLPVAAWGRSYVSIPIDYGSHGRDRAVVRLFAAYDATDVKVDGTLAATLNAGEMYQIEHNTAPLAITSNHPIMAAQYTPGYRCFNANWGDNSMTLLSPLDRMHVTETAFSGFETPGTDVEHQITIVRLAEDINSDIRLDGIPIKDVFKPVPPPSGSVDPIYLYAQLQTAPGAHTLSSVRPFTATAFGLANVQAYAHALTGGNTLSYDDLAIEIDGLNANGVVCPGEELQFTAILEFSPFADDNIEWDFGDGAIALGNPVTHTYDEMGSYPVRVIYSRNGDCIKDTADITVNVAPIELIAEPQSLEFTPQASCDELQELTVRILNNNEIDIDINEMDISDPAFDIIEPTKTPFPIPAGSGVDIRVRFTPDASGAYNAILTIQGAPCDAMLAIPISGEYVAIDVAVEPTTFDFGEILICEVEPMTQTFTVRNNESEAVDIMPPSSSAPFTLSGAPFPYTLEPDNNVELALEFMPNTPGVFDTQIPLVFNAAGCEDIVVLDISAVVHNVDIEVPDLIDFGEFYACDNADTATNVSIRNVSDGATVLRVESIDVEGPFSVDLQPGAEIQAGASLSLTVAFAPDAPALFTGRVTMRFEPCGLEKTITLTGELHENTLSGFLDLDFGAIVRGQNTRQIITLRNNGDVPITLDDATLPPPPYSIVSITPPLPAQIEPGSDVVVVIGFTPIDIGPSSDEILLTYSAPCPAAQSIRIRGEGIGTSETTIRIPNIESEVSATNVRLPLLLEAENFLVQSGARNFRAVVAFDGGMFAVDAVSNGAFSILSSTADEAVVELIVELPTTPALNRPLVELIGTTLISSRHSTLLELRDFEWLDAEIAVERIDGSLTLTDFCIRYDIDIPARPRFSVTPNPSDGAAELVIENAGNRAVSATLVNAVGQTVLRIRSDAHGRHFVRQLPMYSLPAGTYMLRTSVDQFVDTRVVVKID